MKEQLFFNLNDLNQGIPRDLTDGVKTRIFPGENVMISVVRITPNRKGDIHSHPQEQWGVLLEGSGVRIQDGVEHTVTQGDFWCTPGDVPHGFIAGPDGAVILDIFSPPREEYKKIGKGYGA
jgi:quercetin dioxygenase-like cupin family protein